MDRSLTTTWSDPFAAFEEGRKLAPIEHLRAIRDGRIPDPPIARLLGMRLVKVEPGEAVFELMPAEHHYNPLGVVHGGVAFTLLDSAMGCCVQSTLPAGKGYTTLETKANLVRAVTLQTGLIRASARIAPRLRAGALVIHDRQDTQVPWQQGAALAQHWPGARLLTTRGLGHGRILEDDQVARAAVDFIAGRSAVAQPALPVLPNPAPLY